MDVIVAGTFLAKSFYMTLGQELGMGLRVRQSNVELRAGVTDTGFKTAIISGNKYELSYHNRVEFAYHFKIDRKARFRISTKPSITFELNF